jgi:hypothetical protein
MRRMEGIGRAGVGRVLALSASLAATQAARIGEAGQARLGRFQSKVRLGWLGWAARKMEKGRGKGEAGRVGLSFQLGFGPLPNRN